MGNPRSLLAIGATTALVGIAIAATGDPTSGGVVTVASLVLLIYGLHRFGRTGPDEALFLE